MTKLVELVDLQRPDVVRTQRREWRIERIGWLLMGLTVLAGLLGLFGGGPLAHRSRHAGGLTLNYDGMVRTKAPSRIALEIASTGDETPVRVWLRESYMATVQLQHIVPQPLLSFTDSGRLVMDFAAIPGGGPLAVIVEIEPTRIGGHHAMVGVGSDSIGFEQFVFP